MMFRVGAVLLYRRRREVGGLLADFGFMGDWGAWDWFGRLFYPIVGRGPSSDHSSKQREWSCLPWLAVVGTCFLPAENIPGLPAEYDDTDVAARLPSIRRSDDADDVGVVPTWTTTTARLHPPKVHMADPGGGVPPPLARPVYREGKRRRRPPPRRPEEVDAVDHTQPRNDIGGGRSSSAESEENP